MKMKKKLVKRNKNNKVFINKVVAYTESWPVSLPGSLNF